MCVSSVYIKVTVVNPLTSLIGVRQKGGLHGPRPVFPRGTPTPQKTKKTRPVSAPDAVAACRVLLEGIEKDLTPQSIRSEEAARERTWEDKLFAVAGNYVVQRRFLKAKSRPARVVLYLQK